MANFSVEWLSKSYYTTQRDTEEAILQATTQFKDDSLQTKINTDGLLHTEIEGHGKQSRNQYTPTSPNSKFTFATAVLGFSLCDKSENVWQSSEIAFD